jgi:hypothetical protein
MREKTISRSNSRNNSRIKLTSLVEDVDEDVEHRPQPNEITVVQINPPKEKERQPREYTINEVKLPAEQPPKRHKASRPKLLKLLDNKDSREKIVRPNKDRESPMMINNVNLTPSNKKEDPHKNI